MTPEPVLLARAWIAGDAAAECLRRAFPLGPPDLQETADV